MQPDQDGSNRSRREALVSGLKLGIAGLGVWGVGALGGCGSNTRRSKISRIGEPLPGDLDYTPSVPSPHAPVITNPGPRASSSSLSVIPSFVIPRSKWTTGNTREWLTEPMRGIRSITIHHDAISPRPSGQYADSVRRLKAIRSGHLSHQWADIGYHYAIDPAGRVWQGRSLVYQGAHVKNQNPGNIGIVVFGNHEQVTPTASALESLNKLIAHEMLRFGVSMNRVRTHRELAPTACPGKHLQARMNEMRRPGGQLAMAVPAALRA